LVAFLALLSCESISYSDSIILANYNFTPTSSTLSTPQLNWPGREHEEEIEIGSQIKI